MKVSRPIFRPFKPLCHEKIFKISKCEVAYLNMKEFLIQGAKPYNPYVHELENDFQGGYRCTLKIVTPPTYGTVKVSEDTLGFEYSPLSKYWMGRDSFSYSVVNIFGWESDAKCVFINIGIKD